MTIVAIILIMLFVSSVMFIGEAYSMLFKILFLAGFYIFAIAGTVYFMLEGRV